ncbi:hypothetical protein SAMD00024442_63_10 [Candidatus Symbiothrix dinenymphae]|nr:hypothetical protein SAMD00024442_63_10 [Candidatus Symbiothrix dinenymphae]
MRNKFEIGDDGSIFSIDNDGTINRVGKIDSQGRIDGQKPKSKSGWDWVWDWGWVWFWVLVLVSKFVYSEISHKLNSISQLQRENITLQQQKQQNREENQNLTSKITELTNENRKLQNKINSVSNWPLIIKTLRVGNIYNDGSIETDFGKKLYSHSSMFLVPQIEYISLQPKQTITLYQKLYKNDELCTGINSPQGYSTKCDLYLSKKGKTRLAGWGNKKKGSWTSGNYRYEIWYNSMCLKVVIFTLH